MTRRRCGKIRTTKINRLNGIFLMENNITRTRRVPYGYKAFDGELQKNRTLTSFNEMFEYVFHLNIIRNYPRDSDEFMTSLDSISNFRENNRTPGLLLMTSSSTAVWKYIVNRTT